MSPINVSKEKPCTKESLARYEMNVTLLLLYSQIQKEW